MQLRWTQLTTLALVGLLALSLAACGGAGSGSDGPTQTAGGDPANGQTLFAGTCSSCHGPGATGIPGLGKDLTTSDWVAEQSDADLIAFLKVGRPSGDPLNTTGVDMPPKGGNPALSDDDLADIVAYLRSIHN